jgi:hypothetical protein
MQQLSLVQLQQQQQPKRLLLLLFETAACARKLMLLQHNYSMRPCLGAHMGHE